MNHRKPHGFKVFDNLRVNRCTACNEQGDIVAEILVNRLKQLFHQLRIVVKFQFLGQVNCLAQLFHLALLFSLFPHAFVHFFEDERHA